jgi:hypothetical protein
MRLRLVSVVETDQLTGIHYTPYDMFDVSAVGRAIRDDLRERVEDELRRLAGTLDAGSPVDTKVVIGDDSAA